MAKTAKTRKSMSPRSKGAIALILLVALTLFVSYLSVTGIHFTTNKPQVLLPWVPVSSENWPASLPLNRELGGGTYTLLTAEAAEGQNLEEELVVAKKSVEARLEKLSQKDIQVIAQENGLRVEFPKMDSDTLHGFIEFITQPGKFELYNLSNESVFTAPLSKFDLQADASTGYYTLTAEFSAEDTVALNEVVAAQGSSIFNAYVDGSLMASYVSVAEGKMTMSVSSTSVNAVYEMAILSSAPVALSLSHSHGEGSEGEVEAGAAIVLPIVLIASAVLLVLGLICLLSTGKLTGVSAFITVWCAVMLECFFYATVVCNPQVTIPLNIGALLMLVIGLLLALYSQIIRAKEIGKQIGEGNTPKSATKVGLRTAAKKVWKLHGVLLVISLGLMVAPSLQECGYALCCGVVASAIAMPVIRVFQAAFIAINNKSANYGKVK